MSRVAKKPVPVPQGVTVIQGDGELRVKGPKGELAMRVSPHVTVRIEDGSASVETLNGGQAAVAIAGTTRALLNNLVIGVTQGYERKLELVGVGYRAQAQGGKLNLTLGFSHPVAYPVPDGITIETPSQTEIIVRGNDKQQVGQVAAEIRRYRPPEPYKGKGVRYSNEKVVLKEAKKK
ncbi:MAG: 50S ribosomal protein L6 [Chromatiales bacterium]|nr:50S ribosomal protein L6 [Chromatiales bacterium]